VEVGEEGVDVCLGLDRVELSVGRAVIPIHEEG
jgi:hypothetical protein